MARWQETVDTERVDKTSVKTIEKTFAEFKQRELNEKGDQL